MRASRRYPAIFVATLLATIAGQARAADVEATADRIEDAAQGEKNPWRGSAITYEHSFSAVSLDKGAQPTNNPYYAQSLALLPEWHFGEQFFLRGKWIVEQELTVNDDYNAPHEVVVSDVQLELNAAGWTEEHSGVKVSGSLRLVLPASKASRFETLYLGVAPGLALSRKFDVLEGLVVGYQGRFTGNLRDKTTSVYDGRKVQAQPGSDYPSSDTGRRVANWSIGHGPSVTLSATEKLSFGTFYTLARARLNKLSNASPPDLPGMELPPEAVAAGGYNWRDTEWFGIGAEYQLIDSVGIAVGANTMHPQKQPNGEDYTRFFNRLTTLYVDLNIDVDAVTQLF